jgi:hypothetical protein
MSTSVTRSKPGLRPVDGDQTRRVTAQAMIEMLTAAEAAMQRAA